MATNKIAWPHVEISGFDAGLSEEERAIQDNIHRFSANVIRPIGQDLDRMDAEKAYEKGSPFWDFHTEVNRLGIGPQHMMAVPPPVAARMEGLVVTEIAWGDVGLAVSLGAGSMPIVASLQSGQQELIDMCEGKIGCWGATQPDRGSDGLTLYHNERYPGSKGNVGNLTARFVGDEIIINGQTSAWVSNGYVAETSLLDIAADYGDGFYDENGSVYCCNIIVPLDLPGVSKGRPLKKIGKRALPQGEIFFDNVKVPRRWAVATRDDYDVKHALAWAMAGTAMSHVSCGIARAAFEMALNYVNERKQGGALLADLQLTQFRIGSIGAKVEAIKAMARHVAQYTATSPQAHPYFTAAGKAFCSSEMFEVVNESLQLFGGVGLTEEYPIEKLLRDARSMQIEDGETKLLLMHYGYLMTQMNSVQGWGRN